MTDACQIDGCDRPVKVKPRGLCGAHYVQLQRSGGGLPPLERFWIKVGKAEPRQCWEWQGRRDRWGYGQFAGRPAHRVAYERAFNVVVAPDLHVDHICRNHACCNPGHLRPRDAHANMSDNGLRDRLACVHGHLFTAENTRLRTRSGRTHRVCRACDRRRQANSTIRRRP